MRVIRTIVMVAGALVLALALMSCTDDDTVQPRAPLLDVEFGVFNNTVEQGRRLWMELVIVNRGDEAVVLTRDRGCFWAFEVTGELARVLQRHSGGCVSEPDTLTIYPGWRFSVRLSIPTLREDMEDGQWYLDADRMPRGRYRVHGGLAANWLAGTPAEASFRVVAP